MHMGPKEFGGVQARCCGCGGDFSKGTVKVLVMGKAPVFFLLLFLSALDFESNPLYKKH